MDKKSILTVCAVIINGDKVLLVRHGEKALHLTGVYGLPGGRVKPKESLADAVVREVKEETGLIINMKNLKNLPSKYYAEIERKNGKSFLIVVPFLATEFTGGLISNDETIPIWISIKKIRKLKLLPNVKEIIEETLSGSRN